ncbi:MAG TPA: ribonuclease P protein component [Chitinophagaceae bacterium]|nr:ribonuclease P protein component [Chitinophagaceae bacterium]
MAKQFTLGKKERLKSRKQIERLFSKGKKFIVAPFRILYLTDLTPNAPGGPAVKEKSLLQVGVAVSAKNFKKATDRNRIKRLTREAWRLQKNNLKEKLATGDQQLNVFLIYTAREMPVYNLVKEKVAVILQKLSGKLNENNIANS